MRISTRLMTMPGFILLVVELVAVVTVASTESPCNPANRAKNTCLSAIKAGMIDQTAYWFGTDYDNNCPKNEGIFCTNPSSGQSIAMRIFPTFLNLALIDRFLDVTYSHGADSYSGCGVEVRGSSWEKNIDPMAEDRITAWNTRLMPELNFDHSGSQYFALIFMDVGGMLPHAVLVNIEGGDITTADVVKAYHGPQNPLTRPNPYIFLLYKQKNRISVSQQWNQTANTNKNGGFKVEAFADAYSLEGPVAVNFFAVVGDLYTAGLVESRQLMYTCPLFVTEAMERENIPFRPRPGSGPLSVSVDVTYKSEDIEFSLCCHKYDHENETVRVSPFSDKVIYDGVVWSQTERTVAFRKVGLYKNINNFGDDMFTLLLVDCLKADLSSCNSNAGPRLRNLIVNIRNGSISTGSVVAPYTFMDDPQPSAYLPESRDRTLFFLLYKQESQLDTSVLTYRNAKYTALCVGNMLNRCHFKIDSLVQDKKLKLVGATMFSTRFGELADALQLNSTNDAWKEKFCRSDPKKFWNYSQYCNGTAEPSGSDHHSGLSITYIVALSTVFAAITSGLLDCMH